MSMTLPRLFLVLALAVPAYVAAQENAGPQAIDVHRSTMTVHVGKAGVFAFAGDEHEISAPIASGSVDETKEAVELRVNAGELRVLDPGLSAEKRAQVQAKMLGPEVLDAERYREIRFQATAVEPDGRETWLVRGELTLHGQTRAITMRVKRAQGVYRGTATLKQTDFGTTPVRAGGGTVKVKDEVRIEFAIVTSTSP